MRLTHSSSNRGGGVLAQTMTFLLCFAAVVALGWLVLLPGLFTSVVQQRTGFPAKIDYFYANPFTAEVRMRGLVITNPPGFVASNCLEVKQFTAKADLFSLLGGTPVLDMSTIDVGRVTVVTNAQGTTNLDLMSSRLASAVAPSGTVPSDSSLKFLIRSLDLRVNEIVLKDERPGKSSDAVRPLAFQRSYRDFASVSQLNTDLPIRVAEVSKEVAERVSGGLKTFLTKASQPIPQQTSTWADKPKKD
jgi:hypothetical protein